MIAESTPAMKEERGRALALLVSEVKVIEPPGIVHAGQFGVELLLPVEPPEVDALLFERMKDKIEIVNGPAFVGQIEGNILLGCRIDAHGASHGRILLLPRLDAGGGGKIERAFQSLLMDVGEEGGGIREAQMVPGVAGPSDSLA